MSHQKWWRKLIRGSQPTPTKRSRSRSEWPLICTRIAQGFEEERQRFFSGSIKLIEEARTWADPVEILLVHRNLGGVADLALKAYQLGIASNSLGRNVYIPPVDGREFANLLFAQVCGPAIHEVLRLFQAYDEVANDPSTLHARIAGDIGRYITGGQPSLEWLILSRRPLEGLIVMSNIVVAAAFDDLAEVSRLTEAGIGLAQQ